MSLVLKVACPRCDYQQDSLIGTEVRCSHCGNDFRALGHGESSTRIVSATPDDLEHIPYSKRSTEVPRSSASSQIVSDPALLDDILLRDLPMRENARWAGRVRLVKKLGQGGMGAVYRGVDDSLSLEVAVKILPIPPGGRESNFADRFRQEARISAHINSANVVRTRDVGDNGNVVYIVMDFIDGQTARQLLDRKGLIPVPQALQIVHDASLGMQAAHERSIVHRDIKPENILVANDGRVLLADLGLAKLSGSRISESIMPITRMGLLLGTPEYMSPEQWDIGAHITPRSDIWSMGVALWVLLTRRTPFEDTDLGQLSKKIKEAPLPDIRTMRPDVPDQVSTILFHCMAKNPQRRYMNAAALVSALSSAMLHPDQADDEFSVPPQTPSSMSVATNLKPVLATAPVRATAAAPIPTPAVKPAAARTPAPAPIAQPAAKTPATAPAQATIKVAVRPPAAPYVEPPRAHPTPIVAPPKPKSNRVTPLFNKRKSTLTRKLLWLSIPAAAACALFACVHWFGYSVPWLNRGTAADESQVAAGQPATSAKLGGSGNAGANPAKSGSANDSGIALEVHAPKYVKVDEKPILSATILGADDPKKYEIVWQTGKEEPQSGSEITALFKNDMEFDVRVIRVDTRKEVARKSVVIEVDLVAKAIEVSSPDADAPTRFEGSVYGGPGAEKTEVRWIDLNTPNETLCSKMGFEPDLANAKPNSKKIYVFQARRKGTRDWTGAPSDKVAVVVQARVPVAFTQGMKNAEKFMNEAENAETGSAAQLALTDALEACESAQKILPDNKDVLYIKEKCLRYAKAEAAYAGNMSTAREKYYQAEQKGSDYYTKQALLDDALRPCRLAQNTLEANNIRVHPEVLTEIKRLNEMIQSCKEAIQNEKQAQADFDVRIKQARISVKEAEKYQSLAVALPHWEDAWSTYDSLRKQHPRLAMEDGFKLELHKAQENYLKAYLFVNAGFVPGRPEDVLYEKKAGTPVNNQPSRPPTPTTTNKERGTILDP